MIDTYGEYSRHSGAALSGKDPMRIDRVGSLPPVMQPKTLWRRVWRRNVKCSCRTLLGFSRPVSILVETFGTGKIPDEEITALLEKYFDFRLAGIIKQFNLRFLPAIVKGGFYRKLATYGHVGRTDLGILPWEETDMVAVLQGFRL